MTEFWHLVTDPAHWGFEAVSNAASALIGIVIARPFIRRHDRKHHNNRKETT